MMTAALATLPSTASGIGPDFAGELLRREPLLAGAGFFFLGLMLPTGFAALVDARTLAGVGIWEKPLKFEFAIALYLLSLAFFAKWLPTGTRTRGWYNVYTIAIVVGLLAEMGWIGFAAAAGTTSHFNESEPGWAIAYAIAGATAVMFTLAAPVFAFQIRGNAHAGLAPAIKAACVQGLLLTGVLTILVAGTMASHGSHLVGGNASDVEALAILGWARDGGDLRVAHFFATHALHFVPAFGLFSALMFGREKTAPVTCFTVAFSLFTLFTFVQALDGQPFLPALG